MKPTLTLTILSLILLGCTPRKQLYDQTKQWEAQVKAGKLDTSDYRFLLKAQQELNQILIK